MTKEKATEIVKHDWPVKHVELINEDEVNFTYAAEFLDGDKTFISVQKNTGYSAICPQ